MLTLISPLLEAKVGFISVEENISTQTFAKIKRAIDAYEKIGVDRFLLKLDTEGGELLSTIRIAHLFAHRNVTCLIDNMAFSGGAILAFSCKNIYVVKDGVMGAAEPIDGLGESASEKVNSAVRAQISSLAKMHGRSDILARAMVDKRLLVVQRGDDILEVDDIEEYDKLISKKGNLLTLSSDELVDFEIAEIVESVEEVTNKLGEELLTLKVSWKESFLDILSYPIVVSILSFLVTTGIYLELMTSGFGPPGVLAITSLLLLTISQFSLELFSVVEICFLLLGVFLLFVEIFLTPGFGFAGISGIIFLSLGTILMITPELCLIELPFPILLESLWPKLWWSLFVIVTSWIISAIFLVEILTHASKRVDKKNNKEDLTKLRGSEGITCSNCRPYGNILVDNKIYPAKSTSGILKSGCKVKVITNDEQNLLVEDF